MTDYYVRSTDGSDADSGLTWALAKATLAGVEAIPWASGDRVFVSQSHSESTGATVSVDLPTAMPGIQILCGNDAAEPPTALATTGVVITTTVNTIAVSGHGYIYGVSFRVGTGANIAAFNPTSGLPGNLVFENCTIQLNGSSSTSSCSFGAAGSVGTNDNLRFTFKNLTMKFANAGHIIIIRHGHTIISGLTLDSTGSTPTTLFKTGASAGGTCLVENSDLSGETFTNLVDVSVASTHTFIFRNCKLPASVAITTGTFLPGGNIVILDNCDSGDTNYRFAWHAYEGSIISETTIVRTGGATDGATPISWELASSANTTFAFPLRSGMFQKRIAVWNETTGSAVTATVECVTDNVTLTNAEAWIEVEYLGTAGFPQGSVDLDDRVADILTTAANQTSSSETWTTTGLATPIKQKFSATFTPQEKGWVMVTVCLAKASTTVFVDPKIALS